MLTPTALPGFIRWSKTYYKVYEMFDVAQSFQITEVHTYRLPNGAWQVDVDGISEMTAHGIAPRTEHLVVHLLLTRIEPNANTPYVLGVDGMSIDAQAAVAAVSPNEPESP